MVPILGPDTVIFLTGLYGIDLSSAMPVPPEPTPTPEPTTAPPPRRGRGRRSTPEQVPHLVGFLFRIMDVESGNITLIWQVCVCLSVCDHKPGESVQISQADFSE